MCDRLSGVLREGVVAGAAGANARRKAAAAVKLNKRRAAGWSVAFSINEAKAVIKKRLGNSPDRTDAYINGLHAMQFVEECPIGKRDSYSEDEDSIYEGKYSAMKM